MHASEASRNHTSIQEKKNTIFKENVARYTTEDSALLPPLNVSHRKNPESETPEQPVETPLHVSRRRKGLSETPVTEGILTVALISALFTGFFLSQELASGIYGGKRAAFLEKPLIISNDFRVHEAGVIQIRGGD